jgi:hypothetical protein
MMAGERKIEKRRRVSFCGTKMKTERRIAEEEYNL